VFSPVPVKRLTALSLTERISSVTHIISSLEYLAQERERGKAGLNDWNVMGARTRAKTPWLGKVQDVVADRRVTRALHAARVGAGLLLLAPARGRYRVAANAVLTGTSLVLFPRQIYGTDGTDQVSFLVQSAATIARAGERRPQVVDAGLWFIGMQAALSYGASGWAKLVNPAWRNGKALTGVMRTEAYGDPHVWRLFRKYPRAAEVLAAGVLALECLFPVVYLGKGRLAAPFVLSAGAFHLANARLMGLGRFVWAFGSMYPSLFYTTGERGQPGGERRDDLVPVLAAVGTVGAIGAAVAGHASRRAVLTRPRDNEELLTTSSGSQLSYRITGPGDGPSPVIVVVHGMISTAEHWEWVTQGLSGRFSTVTYQRPGYGRSRSATDEPFRFDTAVQDLTDLLDVVAHDRPVVLVGHSLGGYIALRAAERLGARVAGVGLIDSSHPAELRRSKQQAQGAGSMASRFAIIATTLRMGLGSMLSRPDWIDDLPEHVRPLALAQYRDSGMWEAGRREWRTVHAEFQDFDGALPKVDAPVLVVTSGVTAQLDPVHKELQEELGKCGTRADYHVLDDVDHNGILMRRGDAVRTTELIAAFVDSLGSTTRKEFDGKRGA
jgi:pimeloyl-ACP methyl ester carboxylesterase